MLFDCDPRKNILYEKFYYRGFSCWISVELIDGEDKIHRKVSIRSRPAIGFDTSDTVVKTVSNKPLVDCPVNEQMLEAISTFEDKMDEELGIVAEERENAEVVASVHLNLDEQSWPS